MFEAVLRAVWEHDTIILHRHRRPDGDALGSQIGLKHLLMENFPDKKVYMVGDEAGYLSFMEDSVMDTIPDSTYEGALAMVLDCGAKALVSDDRYTLAARTIRIDHHIFCGRFCDLEVIDSDYESCCAEPPGRSEPLHRHGHRLGPVPLRRHHPPDPAAGGYPAGAGLRHEPPLPPALFRKL